MIGIAGTGMIAGVHADAINSISDCKLLVAYARNKNKVDEFASKYKTKAYSDYDEFLKTPGLEIVSICTPSGLHAEYGIKAAQAGKHVIVEKPIETTLEKADALIKACDDAGVKLAVIFQSRTLPDVIKIKRAIDKGLIGKLMLGDAIVKWYRSPEYYAPGSWHGTQALDGGGALINQAIHTVDLLQWLMGSVDTLFAFKSALRYPHIEAEDTLTATLRFKNGALGVIEAATSIKPGFKRRIEISGENGTIILDGDAITTWTIDDESENKDSAKQLTDGSSNPAAISFEGHRIQIEDMIYAVRDNRPPLIDGREARKSLELVTALYSSATSGLPFVF